MLHLQFFDTKQHLAPLHDWLRRRDHAHLPTAEELPELGLVASYGADNESGDRIPVAAGFLRHVEGGYAQFDGLATNPDYPASIRHECLDAVINHALKVAAALGIHRILFMSVDDSTIKRSQKYGFVKLPHTLYALSLNTGAS